MAEKNEKGRKKGSYEAAAMHPAGECPSLRILSLLSFLSAELLFLGVLFTVTAILYLPSSILSSVAAEPRWVLCVPLRPSKNPVGIRRRGKTSGF
jgi:hypothetical protein